MKKVKVFSFSVNCQSINITVNKDRTKWCKVLLFENRDQMRKAYMKYNKNIGIKQEDTDIIGAHCGYKSDNDSQIGFLFLNKTDTGGGVISHEFLHAVLWGYRYSSHKEQYPIVIEDMQDEENIAHCLTHAVKTFYSWLYNDCKPFFDEAGKLKGYSQGGGAKMVPVSEKDIKQMEKNNPIST